MPATQTRSVEFSAQMFVTVEVAADGTVRVLVPEVAPGDLMEFAHHATVDPASGAAGYALEDEEVPEADAAAIDAAYKAASEALADDVYVTISYP